MDGLIDMIIQSVDFDLLDAEKRIVRTGKRFIGKNGEETGEDPDYKDIAYNLPVNGRIELPEGIYEGASVSQTLPTMGEIRVTPSSKEIPIYTKDMYMTSNIYLNKLDNLRPENIKEGEYVGGVGPGTWKGFIVKDPNVFYYRGTIGPHQTLSNYAAFSSELGETLVLNPEEKYLYLKKAGTNNNTKGILVFDSPLDLSSKSKLIIEYSYYMDRSVDASGGTESCTLCPFITYGDPNYFYNAEEYTDQNFTSIYRYCQRNSEFNDAESTRTIVGKKNTEIIRRTATFDVSYISRTAYLSLYFHISYSTFAYYVHAVKFE